jgi:hypothetical protein
LQSLNIEYAKGDVNLGLKYKLADIMPFSEYIESVPVLTPTNGLCIITNSTISLSSSFGGLSPTPVDHDDVSAVYAT